MAVDVKEVKTIKLSSRHKHISGGADAFFYVEQSSDSGLCVMHLNGTASKPNGDGSGTSLKLTKQNVSMLHELCGRLLEEWAK